MKTIILALITSLVAMAVAVPFDDAAGSLAKREPMPDHLDAHEGHKGLGNRGVEAVAEHGHGQGWP